MTEIGDYFPWYIWFGNLIWLLFVYFANHNTLHLIYMSTSEMSLHVHIYCSNTHLNKRKKLRESRFHDIHHPILWILCILIEYMMNELECVGIYIYNHPTLISFNYCLLLWIHLMISKILCEVCVLMCESLIVIHKWILWILCEINLVKANIIISFVLNVNHLLCMQLGITKTKILCFLSIRQSNNPTIRHWK